MFEAVGREFWDIYFKKLKSLLNQNGIIVLQIITIKDNAFEYYRKNPDFIQKHIFQEECCQVLVYLKIF